MDELYARLIETIQKYHPASDLSKVEEAYRLAEKAHEGQRRQSGEPFVMHPLNVAIILAELELDLETIEAGLLHDVAEDTSVTIEDIKAQFGDEVASLVDGVTKLKQLTYKTTDKQEIQAENYRKMFLAMAKDIRVILIKLADRLHNMRTLEYKDGPKQIEKARETLDIYAPIAERLGISKIKVELDDLCLKFLEPAEYQSLTDLIHEKLSQREAYIEEIVEEISRKLKETDIAATVYGRPKHFFSIYKKMVTKKRSLDQIYDLLAVRVIVDTVKDCYGTLGVIHDMYVPIPGRFKDYIAMPKSNMYQSLHTTLMGPSGMPFEVQIRTAEMHRTAEYGIAAHWKYKEGKGAEAEPSQLEKMTWLQKILEWQQDLSDNHDFIDALKNDLDLFKESVYCFTPAGEVITLPAGSTVVDFAYQIHSGVGNRMVGAKINGKIVPLDTELSIGDQVEIMTSQSSRGPSADWLNIAKTAQAKNKINQWFKKEQKQENIQRGKDLIEKYIRSKGMPEPHELMQPEWIELVLRKYGFKEWDSVLAAVGFGGLREGQVVNRLYEEYSRKKRREMTQEEYLHRLEERAEANQEAVQQRQKRSRGAITVKGIEDVAVRFSHCCNPVPGDDIIGYVTRGRGVSIHRRDCPNVLNLSELEQARLLEADWANAAQSGAYVSTLQITTAEKKGLLMELSSVISHLDINIHDLSVRRSRDNMENVIFLGVEISDKGQLEILCNRLQQVPGVYAVVRT